jgi:hypothetical protein
VGAAGINPLPLSIGSLGVLHDPFSKLRMYISEAEQSGYISDAEAKQLIEKPLN